MPVPHFILMFYGSENLEHSWNMIYQIESGEWIDDMKYFNNVFD